MKYHLRPEIVACLICSAFLFAQSNPSSTDQKQEPQASNSNIQGPKEPDAGKTYGPIDIISDTKGVDVHAYLRLLLPRVRANWYKQIPESARLPIMKKGKVIIRFRVMKDGGVTDVQYSERSGDPALDQAAYDGITDSNPLPPLPSTFACQYLGLQFRFYYNPARGDIEDEKATSMMLPCVTTTIRLGGEVGVTVSPISARVVTGAKQQFLAALTGDMKSAVNWSVGGSGCAASTCGVISGDGLYTAPVEIPNPATITVTATLAATPSQTASATVTIVRSGPSH